MTFNLDFYAQSAQEVAKALLGKKLLHIVDGQHVGGIIVETEAYCDSDQPDLACHGSANGGRPTQRSALMFGRAGHVYIYKSRGLHWMFNVVTGDEGQANGVLVRAIDPTDGEPLMQLRRGKQKRPQWTDGPGKLCQAMAIDKALHGVDLCAADAPIRIKSHLENPPISTGPRVGMGKTPEPWYSIPWRFWITDNRFVSAYR